MKTLLLSALLLALLPAHAKHPVAPTIRDLDGDDRQQAYRRLGEDIRRAASKEDIATIKTLAGDPPDPEALSRAAYYALNRDDQTAFATLLAVGLDPAYDRNRVLHHAANPTIVNSPRYIETLLARGHSPNALNGHCDTLLFTALSSSRNEAHKDAIVETLLNAGADLHTINRSGETLLFAAAQSRVYDSAEGSTEGRRNWVIYLLEQGIDPTHTNMHGHSFQSCYLYDCNSAGWGERGGRGEVRRWLAEHNIPLESAPRKQSPEEIAQGRERWDNCLAEANK